MYLYRIIIALLFPISLLASDIKAYPTVPVDSLPSVFMIGEHEFEYEQLVKNCNELLLDVCQDSMQVAYKHWLLMLHDMENYAETNNFDIKGIKIWVNIFWDESGTIDQLVYYPKPNSRNADFTELTSFFEKFVAQYRFPIENPQCFSHYGSATFPTFAKMYLSNQP